MNGLELRDIHLPDASLWWPPAPGWWLILLLLLLLAVTLPWLLRRLRQKPLARLSMLELERIRRDHENGQADKTTVNDIAQLLRRIVISHHGRATHAATTGDSWLDQLQQLAPHRGFSTEQLQLLVRGRYQANCECDVDSLIQACERWIRSLPRGQVHVSD